MDELGKAFGAIWPFFLIGALALGATFALLRSSIARLNSTLGQLRQDHERLGSRLGEIDRRFDSVGQRHSLLVERLEQAEQTLEKTASQLSAQLAAWQQQRAEEGAGREQALDCPPEALERFNAAADALSLVARELEGLDSRQSESWLRIKGDLEEQAFQLQRVQQHVDRLFAQPAQAAAPAAAAASAA